MKKLFLMLICILLLTGCGSAKEVANITESTTAEASTEAVTEEPEGVEKYIDSYTDVDLDGVYMINVQINDPSHIAEVAEYTTQKAAETDYKEFDIVVSYKDTSEWVCNWHSYDNKTGVFINTATGYTEQNVNIDRLYELCNK